MSAADIEYAFLLGLASEYAEEADMPIAIDPKDCGCTECITGEYVPLNFASQRKLAAMFLGRVANNTSLSGAALLKFVEEEIRS